MSKLTEDFDITGKIKSIITTIKMDLHNLVKGGLDWDDTLPDEFRPIWTPHFEIIRNQSNNGFNINYLKYSDSQKITWMFVSGEDMIAYFKTRRVDDLNLVDKDSTWINCYDWMRKDQKCFPGKSIKTRK